MGNKEVSTKYKRYTSVQGAVEEIGVSERTVRRWIGEGHLRTIHDDTGHVRIDMDDVEEKARQQRTPHPLRQQVQSLLSQVEELKAHQETEQRRLSGIEHQMEGLQQRLEACEQILSRVLMAASKAETEGEAGEVLSPGSWDQIPHLLSRLRPPRSATSRPRPSPLDKRGLPSGTLRLVHFAQVHQVKVDEIKHLYWASKIELAVHHRETQAQRNKQEWWITPEQHERLTAYWRQHAIAYVTCPLCAHDDHLEIQAG
jgi:excisionase family DNA binding protein